MAQYTGEMLQHARVLRHEGFVWIESHTEYTPDMYTITKLQASFVYTNKNYTPTSSTYYMRHTKTKPRIQSSHTTAPPPSIPNHTARPQPHTTEEYKQ